MSVWNKHIRRSTHSFTGYLSWDTLSITKTNKSINFKNYCLIFCLLFNTNHWSKGSTVAHWYAICFKLVQTSFHRVIQWISDIHLTGILSGIQMVDHLNYWLNYWFVNKVRQVTLKYCSFLIKIIQEHRLFMVVMNNHKFNLDSSVP